MLKNSLAILIMSFCVFFYLLKTVFNKALFNIIAKRVTFLYC